MYVDVLKGWVLEAETHVPARASFGMNHYVWGALAGLLAFGVGYIHHRWFYPLEFHGDAAAMQTLARAILAQGSLLPSDFTYGNQLIFLRSGAFIALASMSGHAGLDAFMVGSALSVAFWGVILYFVLFAFLGVRWKAALITVSLLLPFGGFEFDYVLGQQSHLANAVLSLGLAVFTSLYVTKKRRACLIAAGICLFVMSVESPLRGLLVLGPVLVAVLVVTDWKKTNRVAVIAGLFFLLAYFSNKKLVRLRPISADYLHMLTFKSTNDIVDNLARTSRETLAGMTSLDVIAGDKLSMAGMIVLGAGLFVIAGYFIFFLAGTISAVKLVTGKHDLPAGSGDAGNESECDRLVRLTSVFGLILGALAVAALNPDSSRHYLWCIFLAKLFLLLWTFNVLDRYFGTATATLSLVVLALLASTWFAYLNKSHWHPTAAIKSRNFTEGVTSLEDISRTTGIANVYGEDFWRMLPLNTLIAHMNAQPLLLEGGQVRPDFWLTMPSAYCPKGDVLYYLKEGQVDREIREKLIGAGGQQMKTGAGYTIWKGPRIWQMPARFRCAGAVPSY